MHTVIIIYFTGLGVFAWTLWFVNELHDWQTYVEIVIWPASIIIGTGRRAIRRLKR
jgi:hypothetical protein